MVNLLIDELIFNITTWTRLSNMELEFRPMEYAPPTVYAGYLPFKGESKVDDFPYVIVRALHGTNDKKVENKVTIKIQVGAYSEDPQEGWRYVLNILERLQQNLLKKSICCNCRLDMPVEWTLPEEQPMPEWVGWLETTWVIPTTREEEAWLE